MYSLVISERQRVYDTWLLIVYAGYKRKHAIFKIDPSKEILNAFICFYCCMPNPPNPKTERVHIVVLHVQFERW